MFAQLANLLASRPPPPPAPLQIGGRTVPLVMVRHPRARRYVLRLRPDGSARVTIPRGGSRQEAEAFVARQRGWLEQQLARLEAQPRVPPWLPGSEILFRGQMVRIDTDESGIVRLGTEVFKVSRLRVERGEKGSAVAAAPAGDADRDLRPLLQRHFLALAKAEFPLRVAALAAQHQFSVQRVSVRNQKSRWGSCSRRGTISLNWRLIQTPLFVLDYLILHELAHLRHMNHSRQFWQEVERLDPHYRIAEQWLKAHREWLR